MYSEQQQKQLQQLTTNLLSTQAINVQDKLAALPVVDDLHQVLKYHDWRYYVLAEPTIKDVDYDYLFDYLKRIETAQPDLLKPDSPTQRVARGLSEDFPTVPHTVPMLSLAKAYKPDDLRDWDTSVKKLLEEDEIEYIIEPKFDGASIALVYENNLLIRGATRGNGAEGDDITNNIKTLATIPLSANFAKAGLHKVELRGEVVIHKKKFEQLNKDRAAKGEKLLSNPRNSAAGALRQKDSSKVAERKLEAFIYQMGYAANNKAENQLYNLATHGKSMQLLYQQGFKTPLTSANDNSNVLQGMEAVIEACNKWQAKRDAYPYEIDGIVIKVNNYKLQDIAGATSHHPRWAIALKFDAQQAMTILEDITFQVGRTGAITPVANLKTVNVAGANISNASLHNADFIKDKDIQVGDTVVIERAGDVIPYIVRSIPEKRDGSQKPVEFPSNCPVCESALEKPEEEIVWRCVNMECPAQVEARIIHFVSKNAMDIAGLGKDIVKRFFKDKLLQRIPDIYQLPYDQIQTLDGWGEKSVVKLRDSVAASKDQELNRLIIGLGIRDVGGTTAKLLAQTVTELEELANWNEEQLMELPDVGPKVAANICQFFSNEQSLRLIKDLKSAGVNTHRKESEAASEGGQFQGLIFLFTGALQELKRNEAKKMVEDRGGKVVSAVSKKLNYLVVGEAPGSKLKKAQKIETIKIISEAEFLEMVD